MTTDARRRRELALLAAALVLSMSPWFSTAAVLGQLRENWELSTNQASWLTILVQVGSAEVLLDDSTRLAERAREVGVEVDLR